MGVRRLRSVRDRAGAIRHSQLLRVYGPGMIATAAVLTMMFGLRWLA